ncbi:hypothetical protein TWF506_006247 [Arthrobotrys conoides]|uniref:Uncharacterized protein n=1 Tax=Arthrobotrys conoides TaxID=74498 RepID=A0AAN8NQM3_9PEZI
MSTNAAAHLVNLPAEVVFRILSKLVSIGERQGLEQIYSYPKATALGPPGVRVDPNKNLPHRLDAISRCCKKLRFLSLPYLFRYRTVSISDKEAAIPMLQAYLNDHWLRSILHYAKTLYFVMDIRAIIEATLPMSVMKPNLNALMSLIAKLFQYTGRVEELHFIVRSEIVSNGLRRIFQCRQQQIENSLCNVRSLKFSAGSEWIIRFCGGFCGLRELENSPIKYPRRLYVPYCIDFAREPSQSSVPQENLSHEYYKSALSRVGQYKAAKIMEGISALRWGPETLTKVTIYGKFTASGLDVFVKFIPAVSHLTIIGGPIKADHAHILGQLPYLRLLSFESGEVLRETLQICPESTATLWHFGGWIRTLQHMWVEARFVGKIVRDIRGDVLPNHTIWRDSWADFGLLNSGDVVMGGS